MSQSADFDRVHCGAERDLLIAAHAQAVSAVLITNNTDEFGRIEGLAIESWAS